MIIKKRVALEAISRQKRMKFFGQANEESNKGCTVIGSLTYIQYLDEKKVEVKKPLTKFKINASTKAYKPNIDKCSQIDIDSTLFKSGKEGFSNSGYVPSNIKKCLQEGKDMEPVSIILKNFPTYTEVNILKDVFRKYFSKYGDIKRITILKDKQNNIKDIAFMEFYYNKDALRLLENPPRLIIGKQIVSIQKNRPKRKVK
jgi:RNA recognition motif-containing protein